MFFFSFLCDSFHPNLSTSHSFSLQRLPMIVWLGWNWLLEIEIYSLCVCGSVEINRQTDVDGYTCSAFKKSCYNTINVQLISERQMSPKHTREKNRFGHKRLTNQLMCVGQDRSILSSNFSKVNIWTFRV